MPDRTTRVAFVIAFFVQFCLWPLLPDGPSSGSFVDSRSQGLDVAKLAACLAIAAVGPGIAFAYVIKGFGVPAAPVGDSEFWRLRRARRAVSEYAVCMFLAYVAALGAYYLPAPYGSASAVAFASSTAVWLASWADNRLRTRALTVWISICSLANLMPLVGVATAAVQRPRTVGLVALSLYVPCAIVCVSALSSRKWRFPRLRGSIVASGRVRAIASTALVCLAASTASILSAYSLMRILLWPFGDHHPLRLMVLAVVAAFSSAIMLAALATTWWSIPRGAVKGLGESVRLPDCVTGSLELAITTVRTSPGWLAVGYVATSLACLQIVMSPPRHGFLWPAAASLVGGVALWLQPLVSVAADVPRALHASLATGLRNIVGSMKAHLVIVGYGDVGQRVVRDLAERDHLEVGDVPAVSAISMLASGEVVWVVRSAVVLDKTGAAFVVADNSQHPPVGLVDTGSQRGGRRIMLIGVVDDANRREARLFVRMQYAKQVVCVARDDDAPFSTIGDALSEPEGQFDLLVSVPTAAVLPAILARVRPPMSLRQIYLPDTRGHALADVVRAAADADFRTTTAVRILVVGSGRPTLFVLDALAREFGHKRWDQMAESGAVGLACVDPSELGLEVQVTPPAGGVANDGIRTNDKETWTVARKHYTRSLDGIGRLEYRVRLFTGDASIGSFAEAVVMAFQPTIVVVFDQIINVELRIARVLVGLLNAQPKLIRRLPRIILAGETGRNARTQFLAGSLEAYRGRFDFEVPRINYPRQFATSFPNDALEQFLIVENVTGLDRYRKALRDHAKEKDNLRKVVERSLAIGDSFVDVLDEPSERVQSAVQEVMQRSGTRAGFDLYVCFSVGSGVLAALTARLARLRLHRWSKCAAKEWVPSLSRTHSRTSRHAHMPQALYVVGMATLVEETADHLAPRDNLRHVERSCLRVRQPTTNGEADNILRGWSTLLGLPDNALASNNVEAARKAIDHECPSMLLCPVAASMDDVRARIDNAGRTRSRRNYVRTTDGGAAVPPVVSSEAQARIMAISHDGRDPGTLARMLSALVYCTVRGETRVGDEGHLDWNLWYVFDASCHNGSRSVTSFHGEVADRKVPQKSVSNAETSAETETSAEARAENEATSEPPPRPFYGLIIRVVSDYPMWNEFAHRLVEFLNAEYGACCSWAAHEVIAGGATSGSTPGSREVGLIVVGETPLHRENIAILKAEDESDPDDTYLDLSRNVDDTDTFSERITRFIKVGFCSKRCLAEFTPCRCCRELRAALTLSARLPGGDSAYAVTHGLSVESLTTLAAMSPEQGTPEQVVS